MLFLPVEWAGDGSSQLPYKLNYIVNELLLKSSLGLFKILNCLLLAPVLQCPLTVTLMGELLH